MSGLKQSGNVKNNSVGLSYAVFFMELQTDSSLNCMNIRCKRFTTLILIRVNV